MSKEQIKRVFKKVVESGGKEPVSKAMREVGYKEGHVRNPQKITKSKTWEKLVEKRLSDDKLTEVHEELLNSTRLDHMVFPPERHPEEFDEEDFDEDEDEERIQAQSPDAVNLSDGDIKKMLEEVNCKVRKIVHGQMARHVYFWAADNKARKEALDMAYKLKDKYPQRPNGPIVPIQINFGEDKEKYG